MQKQVISTWRKIKLLYAVVTQIVQERALLVFSVNIYTGELKFRCLGDEKMQDLAEVAIEAMVRRIEQRLIMKTW